MLFNYPSFINKKEQDKSELLYNNIYITLKTVIGEIPYDIEFGTNVEESIKKPLDALLAVQIKDTVEVCLMKYFSDEIKLNYIDISRDFDKIFVELNYTDLRTGKQLNVQAEEVIPNNEWSENI